MELTGYVILYVDNGEPFVWQCRAYPSIKVAESVAIREGLSGARVCAVKVRLPEVAVLGPGE